MSDLTTWLIEMIGRRTPPAAEPKPDPAPAPKPVETPTPTEPTRSTAKQRCSCAAATAQPPAPPEMPRRTSTDEYAIRDDLAELTGIVGSPLIAAREKFTPEGARASHHARLRLIEAHRREYVALFTEEWATAHDEESCRG
ncbi:hypothetical protein NE236_41485 [Actinoallomurus purpureus]|uniref:hypothetical protein n=1 Tax=Actinoallomurus purpureus TaxID=478114 RepID=UPI002093EBDC|nr:hypothetical protein [Actinoallomurus purpureus]MCO6011442.1 hypothetical protein [Actinoallomurus purpureus]